MYSFLKVYLLTGLLLSYVNIFSQENREITGYVVDAENKQPIPDVNITIPGTDRGSTTNVEGFFSIIILANDSCMNFSHIAYHSSLQEIPNNPNKKWIVGLQKKSKWLEEVSIESSEIKSIYKDKEYTVLDYEITDSAIFLLACKNNLRKAGLILLDFKGDTLFKYKQVDFKPFQLNKDCLGNIHLLNRDSTYQVYLKNGEIKFRKPASLVEYKEVMYPCITAIKEYVYVRKYYFHKQIIQYFIQNSLTDESYLLKTIYDEENLTNLRRSGDVLFLPENNQRMSEISAEMNERQNLSQLRNLEHKLRFIKMAYYRNLYAPLFRIKDKICIFNIPACMLEIFDCQGVLLKTTRLPFARQHRAAQKKILPNDSKKWNEKIIVDDATGRLFALFENKNKTELWEIDTDNGRIKRSFAIPFLFPQKIQVYNNRVYFIYKGLQQNEKSKLFQSRPI